MDWNRKSGKEMLDIKEKNGVVWLEFPALAKTGMVKHGFSTRLGGVSEGEFSTMNFTFTRGDNPDHVKENYRRMSEALLVDEKKMVQIGRAHV